MEWRIYALPGGIFPQGLSFCVFCGVALNHLSDEKEESTEIDTIIEDILLQDQHIRAHYDKLKKNLDSQKIQIDRFLYEYLQLCTTISSLEQKLAENNKSAFIKKEIEKLETEQKQYLVDDVLTEHYT